MKKNTLGIIRNILFFLAFLAIGGTVGIFIAKNLSGIGFWGIILLISILIMSFILTIQLHEIGHFLFGKLSGYNLLMLKVGPFCYKYENGVYKFFIDITIGYAGLCMMIPPEKEISEKRHVLYYAGGIIMNILTGCIAIYLAILFPYWNPYLVLALWIFGGISLILGGTNLIPTTNRNKPTDGKIIFSYLHKEKLAQDITFLNTVMQQLVAGVRPRDIALLNQPLEDVEDVDIHFIYRIMWHLNNALDHKDKEKMAYCARLMEKHSDKIPTSIELQVKFEFCCAYCMLGENRKAQEFYTAVRSWAERENDMCGYRVKAYIAYYLLRDINQATTYCKKAMFVADSFPMKGQAIMEQRLINSLLASIYQSR
ncbi:M50 family metallopeptidase [Parabacteroides sp. OttesenSCG-928-O15]|nr:M50 family metallopeptidase [Parabacteroides sp. OttesenSCG-928-O15]